ncbi:MAG: hypothetical protein J3R72DRAFT_441423, partial [Linnemannia gamsii]
MTAAHIFFICILSLDPKALLQHLKGSRALLFFSFVVQQSVLIIILHEFLFMAFRATTSTIRITTTNESREHSSLKITIQKTFVALHLLLSFSSQNLDPPPPFFTT